MGKNTVKLKKYVDINVEYEAHAAITPGMLIEVRSDGKVQKHGTEGGVALPMFALEDELQGKTIDDDYSAESPVQCWVSVRGEEVYALLSHGESVDEGDFLVSKGDGTLKEADSVGGNDAGTIVAMALEDLDLSSSDLYTASGRRLKVRIF